MARSAHGTVTLVPGAYWRAVLSDAAERRSRWSMGDLMGSVAGCDASLVDVAGWLSDELGMGRVQHAPAWPEHYEIVPGVRLQQERVRR